MTSGFDVPGSAEGSGGGAGPQTAPESQLPSMQKLSAALANVGDLAACFPDTQAPQAAALPAMPGKRGCPPIRGWGAQDIQRIQAGIGLGVDLVSQFVYPLGCRV